jgi:Rad3-related DNA helicase
MEIEIEEEKSLLGFCVMGGIFSEGIDLKNDSLIGAIIVGTGIPQVCPEREILKQYFDREDGNGFDYAYKYPGMNKVLQAAGRVIRTKEDAGVIALLDERFLQNSYKKMFPEEWQQVYSVDISDMYVRAKTFWEEL